MRQIFHIFKKDIRRHSPEILISLTFLGLYAKVTLQSSGRSVALLGGFSWFWFSAESVPALMVVFWIFLTVRVVQGEALVGDRQWWVTKPYQWWKLLAAKELFQLVFIGLPLFVLQLFLLRHAGFPVSPNLLRVLYMQLALAVFLFLPSVTLGSLTRNLWQAVLAVVLVLVAVAGVANLLQTLPSYGMSSHVQEFGGGVSGVLLMASIIGALGWQFARRRTWASRSLLVTGPALTVLLSAVTPYAKLVEKKYPLAEANIAPVRFTFAPPSSPAKKKRGSFYEPSVVYPRLPFLVSGIATGHAVQIDGMRVFMESAGSPKWDSGWQSRGEQLWTESQRTDLTYSLKRKEFETRKTQPVRLHVELALSEYLGTEPREVILEEGRFLDPQLGACHLEDRDPSSVSCVRPFRASGLMASFDPSSAHCGTPEDDRYVPDTNVSHSWFLPHYDEDSSSALLSPVVEYSIAFGSRSSWSPGSRPKVKRVYLCPGARIKLAKPNELGHLRVALDLDGVYLEHLLNTPEFDSDQ